MQPFFSVRNVYGDHMVLQRDLPVRVAGTAVPGMSVRVRFAEKEQIGRADADGEWEVSFPAMSAGGPYEMTVENDIGAMITFRDMLVGEVWLCSGQSNMEFTVNGPNYFYSLRDGEAVAKNAHDDRLRLLQVPHALNPDGPSAEMSAGASWTPATSPDAVKMFSAVGYWFGVFLREKFGDVPVGIINSSWGGSTIQPWIAEEAYIAAGRKVDIDAIASGRVAFGPNYEAERMRCDAKRMETFKEWIAKYMSSDPEATAAALSGWAKPGIDLSGWRQTTFSHFTAANDVGVAWFRREIAIPPKWAGRRVVVHMDAVSDCDEAFVDGVKIGETGFDVPKYWMAARNYALPEEVSAPGTHVLAVRVMNHYSTGGIYGKAWLACGEEHVDIDCGEWAERVEFKADLKKIGTRPTAPGSVEGIRDSYQSATTLYNAMIHPFTKMNLRGFLWYQGCSNTGDPDDYRNLQPMLIDCWRRAWGLPDAAFIIAQLSAFERHSPEDRLPEDYWRGLNPDNPGYARLREVQDEMRGIPGVGVAVTIDIGDSSDIHPHNKKDVAFRMFRQAERLCYGSTGTCEGPRYSSKTVEDGKLRVSFSGIDGGLTLHGDTVGEHSFAVAGADGRYVWANAVLDGNTVLVWSPEVPDPVDVRYAWAMCPPNPNLYNGEGFPAFPFRTDKY